MQFIKVHLGKQLEFQLKDVNLVRAITCSSLWLGLHFGCRPYAEFFSRELSSTEWMVPGETSRENILVW